MDICDYSDGGSITINSVFDACVDSYNYTNTDIDESVILEMLRSLGEECEPEETYYPGTELAVVDYIVDGDTISVFVCPDLDCSLAPLESSKIRLYHTSVNEANTTTGDEATAYVESLFDEGDTISFDRYGEDPYGRILAIVYTPDGTNLNEALIASGWGRPWTAEESTLYETEVEEGESSEAPYGTAISFVEVTSMPEQIVLGSANWIGASYINNGDEAGKYWLGVRLEDEDGTSWRYTGSETYASTVDAGETKVLWCKFTPPTTLSGNLRIFLILNKSE